MAKQVDQYSTIETFRQVFNEVSSDMGDTSGLRTESQETLVDAVNSIEDKAFFFQEYRFVATAGQTTFSGNDVANHELEFKANRVQVYVNGIQKNFSSEYSISGFGILNATTYNSIQLQSAASVGDEVTIFSFTGSYLGTDAAGSTTGFWSTTATGDIYNNNSKGVIINGEVDPRVTSRESSDIKIQLEGKTKINGDVTVHTGGTLTSPTLTDGSGATITGGDYAGIDATLTGDLSVGDAGTFGGTLGVTGNTTVGGTFGVQGASTLSSSLDVTGITNLNSTTESSSTSTGALIVDGGVGIKKKLFVGGNVDFAANLQVDGNSTLSGSVNIDGATDIDSTLDVLNNTTLRADLGVTGNTSMTGTLDVDGATTLDGTRIDGDLDLNGSADISTNALIGGTLGVTGATTLSSTLDVTGTTNFNSTTQSSSTTTGAVRIDGGLGIAKNTHVGGTLGVTGNTSLGGTLGVTGNTSVGGTLGVTGLTSLSDASLSGTLDVTGQTNLNNTAQSTSLSSGALIVDGGVAIAKNLNVGGNITATGNITANGNITFGDADTDNIVFNADVDSGIMPDDHETYDLGAVGKTWRKIYAKDFYGELTGNASTATALETARTLGGVSFDGTANINLPGVNASGNQDTSGNAASATILETARTIGGVSFDGSAAINLPGVNTSGNQDTSGNAGTATTLATARSISGQSFDGSSNITLKTSGITEETNLYFTNARADARADTRIGAADIEDLNNVSSGASSGQVLVWSGSAWAPGDQSTSTSSVGEDANFVYFTDNRVADTLKVSNGTPTYNNGIKLSYNDNADGGDNTTTDGRIDLALDYEITSSAPTAVGSTSSGHLWFVI
jgi:hypothetical protein